MLVFEERENRSTQRNTSRSKDENQQQTQPTYDAESGNWTRATLAGGKCCHHCAIPALKSWDAYLASPASFAGADDIITNLAKEREPGDIECAP